MPSIYVPEFGSPLLEVFSFSEAQQVSDEGEGYMMFTL
jgi:hypothetical protein